MTMLTRWEIIRRLRGRNVLDVGGSGYDDDAMESPVRKALNREAWQGVARTVLDINPRADIVIDLNKLPLPTIEGQWDVAVLFDMLEHVKHPAAILDWVPCREAWVNLPAATPDMHKVEREMQKQFPEFQHIFGWTLLAGANLCRQCGWKIMESSYNFDYQSWRGHLFSAAWASRFPRWYAHGCFYRCVR